MRHGRGLGVVRRLIAKVRVVREKKRVEDGRDERFIVGWRNGVRGRKERHRRSRERRWRAALEAKRVVHMARARSAPQGIYKTQNI
jgi:hypothetical protein